MKRYWLFEIRGWEALGGLDDLKKSSDSVKELIDYDTRLRKKWYGSASFEIAYIFDSTESIIVKRFNDENGQWEDANDIVEVLKYA